MTKLFHESHTLRDKNVGNWLVCINWEEDKMYVIIPGISVISHIFGCLTFVGLFAFTRNENLLMDNLYFRFVKVCPHLRKCENFSWIARTSDLERTVPLPQKIRKLLMDNFTFVKEGFLLITWLTVARPFSTLGLRCLVSIEIDPTIVSVVCFPLTAENNIFNTENCR